MSLLSIEIKIPMTNDNLIDQLISAGYPCPTSEVILIEHDRTIATLFLSEENKKRYWKLVEYKNDI